MNLFAVSFFGHRQVDDPFLIERQLESIIREPLLTKEYVEFLVGRDGEFDQLVSSTVRRCKRTIRDDNSSLVLVATMTYGDQNDKDNNIYYRILKTTFYEGDPEEITGLHTEALGVLFPVGLILRKSLMFWNTLQANLMIPKSSRWLKVQNL